MVPQNIGTMAEGCPENADPGSTITVAMPNYTNADLQILFASRAHQNPGAVAETTAPQIPELTPKIADEAIAILKTEFDKSGVEDEKGLIVKEGYRVQKGMVFDAIERKLREPKNAAVLVSISKMAQPAVICEKDGRCCIAETFGRTLPERANCVYDKMAEEAVIASGGHCNGNAIDQSKAAGVPLMEESIARGHFVVPFSDTNQYCYDYVQASETTRKEGFAPYLYRDYGEADVYLGFALNRSAARGWRGALWVES